MGEQAAQPRESRDLNEGPQAAFPIEYGDYRNLEILGEQCRAAQGDKNEPDRESQPF